MSTASADRPNVLVLFTGALLGFEDSVASLRRLVSDGWVLDWRQTPAASRILDQGAIESIGMTPAGPELVRNHEVLLIPTMTVNVAAKVAHGIGDCLASNLMAEFIMTNKTIVASVAGSCPDAPEKRGWFPTMPEGYAEMLRGNLARLRAFGVHLATPGRLDAAMLRALDTTAQPHGAAVVDHHAQLVTATTVAGLPDGATVRLEPGTVVTPLAREAARSRGIVLTHREEN